MARRFVLLYRVAFFLYAESSFLPKYQRAKKGPPPIPGPVEFETRETPMRLSIRLRQFLAMLSVLALAITSATGVSVYFITRQASQNQTDHLRRIVRTLSDSTYPLTQSVLYPMAGLCGGEFVLLDESGGVIHATIPLGRKNWDQLSALLPGDTSDLFSRKRIIMIKGRRYFADMISVNNDRNPFLKERLCVLYPKQEWWTVAREVAPPILWTGCVVLLIGMGIAAFLASELVRPIQTLRNQAEAIAGGDFDPIGLPKRNDEIRDLAVALNRMAARLRQFEDDVRQNERWNTLSRLGAGMAHQLRNCATGARMAIELGQETDQESEPLGQAMCQLRLMESHLQRFLSLERTSDQPKKTLLFQDLIGEILALIEPTCRHQKIQVEYGPPHEPVWIWGEEKMILQLIMNLVLNAVDAVGSRRENEGRIKIELEAVDAGAKARFVVADNGPGPPPELGETMFDLLVTSKPEGTGFGLYISRHVVENHQGTLRWARENGWTRFMAELPQVNPLKGGLI